MDSLRTRLLVLWVPDWPVVAQLRALESGAGRVTGRMSSDAPIALIEKGEVFACSAAARAEGVRRGLRQREAQARCPGLRVLRYDAALDARVFEPVLSELEQSLPGLHPLRPGTVAVRARGPARYYGGERTAALTMIATVAELGVPGARVGIADGLFAAEMAARSSDAVTIVPPGAAGEFLSPLPVALLEQPELGSLLPRLGIHTLGEFAALESGDVATRFGPGGARLHALAGGRDPRPATPRIPPRDVDVQVDFEPPLDRADQIAFGVRAASDGFVTDLLAQRLVCTAVRIELIGEKAESSERVWLHPRSFSPAEIVDRVRWQLEGSLAQSGSGDRAGSRSQAGSRDADGGELRSAVTRVRISPESVDAVGAHERGLWGTGPDDGVHSGLSRVQSMVGHRGVVTGVSSGGRSPAERQQLVPWGDRPILARDARRPWPGSLPDPAPATVYELPRELAVLDARGAPVSVNDRGTISAPPAVMVAQGGARRDLTSWAGPWPLDERWWDPLNARSAQRFQVVDESGEAWLLVLDEGGWWCEGHYD